MNIGCKGIIFKENRKDIIKRTKNSMEHATQKRNM